MKSHPKHKMTTVLSGLNDGDFTSLRVLKDGELEDVLALIAAAAASGGGSTGGSVTSVQAPLALSSQGVLQIDLSAYTDTTSLVALLASYVLSSSLFDGIAIKLADSGGTFRNLAASQTSAITWNGAQLVDINALTAQGYVSTLNATLPLTVTGTGPSRVVETLFRHSTVTVGMGLVALSSDTLGTLSLGLTGTESRAALKLADSQGTVRDLASTTAGALTWDGVGVQPLLQYVSEGTAGSTTTVYGPTNTTAWIGGGHTNIGTHQSISGPVYAQLLSFTPGVAYTWSMELRSSTNSSCVIATGDNTAILHGASVSLTSTFQPVQFNFVGYANTRLNIHIGFSFGSFVQPTPINVDVKDITISVAGNPAVLFSQQIQVQGDVRLTGSVVSLSDRALKEQTAPLDEAKCLDLLKAVEPKTYIRTDLEPEQVRCGFLAQDVAEAISEADLPFTNVVSRSSADPQYLGVDYARISALLWAVCRSQEARIAALEGKKGGKRTQKAQPPKTAPKGNATDQTRSDSLPPVTP